MVLRGLYTSSSGMLATMNKTDVISNNIANINTNSFKHDRVIFRAYPELNIHRVDDPSSVTPKHKIDAQPFIGMLGTGVVVEEINTNFIQGNIKSTSNPLELAIDGAGFFQILTPQGTRYTRCGEFTTNAEGFLVTKSGHNVLGENGPIQLPRYDTLIINETGEIIVNGQTLDRLSIVSFANLNQITKVGDNLYTTNQQPIQQQIGKIIQGALEQSNVSSAKEMANLITAFREYEANQKAVMAHDDTLGKAVNEIARM
jgi:flagellar basal-body rod protein FlgF